MSAKKAGKSILVAIADEEIRKTVIASLPDIFMVTAQAIHTKMVLDLVRKTRPDITLIHLSLPGQDVFQLIEAIEQMHLTKVILMAKTPGVNEFRKALHVGVRDLLPEEMDPSEFRASILAALQSNIQPTEGRIVTIFGTKGGVGKTTIAVNLAVGLGDQTGRTTALLDMDLEFGNASLLLGHRPRASIVDLCRRTTPITPQAVSEVVEHIPDLPVVLLAAPPSPDLAAVVDGDARREPSRNYVQETLNGLKENYSWIVVDTSRSYTEGIITTLDLSYRIVLVTTPDIPSLSNTAKALDVLIDRLEYPAEKILVALNRSNAVMGMTEADIAKALDFPISFRLPSDGDAAVRSANLGIPLIRKRGKDTLSRAVTTMADQLIRQIVDAKTAEVGG